MKLGKILYSPHTIRSRVAELAATISDDYDDLVVIVILNGAMIFASDLIRQISIPVELDTISISSYGGTESGKVRLNKDIDIDIVERDVLFVEDIIDTGQTMKYLFELFKERGAASVKLCSFYPLYHTRYFFITHKSFYPRQNLLNRFIWLCKRIGHPNDLEGI